MHAPSYETDRPRSAGFASRRTLRTLILTNYGNVHQPIYTGDHGTSKSCNFFHKNQINRFLGNSSPFFVSETYL